MNDLLALIRKVLFVPIHPAGYPFIGIFAVVALLLSFVSHVLFLVGIVLTLWCVYFFRNPVRVTPVREGLVVSPADGMVQMIIAPETSSLHQNVTVPIAAGVNAPAIDIRRADTVAITPDGQTVVIGGLMASDKGSSESKVPFLGDIPLLGNLFKRKSSSSAKTELMIFLTPHIIQAPSQLAALAVREQNNSPLIQKSVSEEELDRFLERVPAKKDK